VGLDGKQHILEKADAAVVAQDVDGVYFLCEDEGDDGSVDDEDNGAQVENYFMADAGFQFLVAGFEFVYGFAVG
jgi:hypothetical protein